MDICAALNFIMSMTFLRRDSRCPPFALYGIKADGRRLAVVVSGFTLVELLIAIIVVLVAIIGSAAAFNFAVRSMSSSSDKVKLDSLVEADLAKLNLAASRYTYCSGEYTWDGSVCGSSAPGSQNYYFPPTSSSSSANADQFVADCADKSMTDDLVGAIQSSDASLQLNQDAARLGLSRSAAKEGDSHRIKVQYSIGSSVYRESAILPLVAGWCP